MKIVIDDIETTVNLSGVNDSKIYAFHATGINRIYVLKKDNRENYQFMAIGKISCIWSKGEYKSAMEAIKPIVKSKYDVLEFNNTQELLEWAIKKESD